MADKYLALINGTPQGVEATVVSAGSADAGKIMALDSNGRMDISATPAALTAQVCSAQAAVALSAGDWVTVYDSAGITMVDKASATVANRRCLGYVNQSYLAGAAVSVIIGGTNLNDLYFAGDVGKIAYLSTTAGKSQLARPTAAGQRYQELGAVIKIGSVFVVAHLPSGMEYII